MKTVTILAVRADATYVAGQAEGWGAAISEAVRWASDPFYTRGGGFVWVFLSDGSGLEKHTVWDLRAEAALRGGVAAGR